MEQAGKNTILLVRGTAAEPVGLSAFAAAQPDVQVQTVSGLDEARTALGRQHPTLIVMQSDAPGGQDLRRGRGAGDQSGPARPRGALGGVGQFRRRARPDAADPDADGAGFRRAAGAAFHRRAAP